MTRIIAIILAGLMLSGFAVSNELQGERKAQQTLAKSADPIWKTLRKTTLKLNEKEWIYTATIAPEVKALDGKTITVQGFMLPLENAQKQTHFLLSRLTPVCPFCPPGEPNEIIEVQAKDGIGFTYDLIKITGVFSLTNQGDRGIFYQMKQAAVAPK